MRVLLTGTPVQNELSEFFAMMDFACPGLLGSAAQFNRIYGGPVEAGQDRGASAEAKRLSRERSDALGRLTAPWMLRRTREVNAAYLPPKREYVVLVRAAPAQQARTTPRVSPATNRARRLSTAPADGARAAAAR